MARPDTPSNAWMRAVSLSHRDARDAVAEYKRLNTREARATFADHWLGIWAYEFDHAWPMVYELLKLIEEDRLYEDPRRVGPAALGASHGDKPRYDSFEAYFADRIKRPFEHWAELERPYQYVSTYAPELLGGTFPEAQQATATALDDQRDEAKQRRGGRPPNASKLDARDVAEQRQPGQPSNETVDNVHSGRPEGTSRQRALRQLRKADEEDHLPGAAELRAEVFAEKRSPHSALVELGLRPRTIIIPAGPADRVAAALRRHMTPDDRVQLASYSTWTAPVST